MSNSGWKGRAGKKLTLVALLLLPAFGVADPSTGAQDTASRLSIRLVVRPALRVLEVTPLQHGQQYRVWTNMKSAWFQGREYHFDRIGEHTLIVPAPPQPTQAVPAS